MSRKTVMPARSSCMFLSHAAGACDDSVRAVAGRSFGQVRRDLLLQIDPSAFDPELVTS
jgi:hypothetical protein